MLRVSNLRTGYDKKEVVHGADFTVENGNFTCIIGANGCGKTTALKGILGLLPLFAGTVSVDGADIIDAGAGHVAPARERAKIFAYIPQVHSLPFPFLVSDVVLLGRTPHLASSVAGPSDTDKIAAYHALETLGIESIAKSVYTELSGGQQQLVLIARALAQQPRVLIMDEPTASLDYGNQQMVLQRLRALGRGGMSIIMVTHDPHHVLLCADTVIVMQDGVIRRVGTPEETVTAEMLCEIFGVRALVTSVHMQNGEDRKTVVPL